MAIISLFAAASMTLVNSTESLAPVRVIASDADAPIATAPVQRAPTAPPIDLVGRATTAANVALAMGSQAASARAPIDLALNGRSGGQISVGAGIATGQPGPPQTAVAPLGPDSTLPATPPANAPGAVVQSNLKNPFKRDIDLTMALTYDKRELGELPVTLTRDDRVLVHTQEFVELIGPLLNPAGQKAVTATIGNRQAFEPDLIRPAGVSLQFDPAGLSVVILKIEPGVQSPRLLYAVSRSGEQAAVPPSAFAAYVNASGGFSWSKRIGTQPYFDLQGVIHYNHFVLESEFVGQEAVNTGSVVEGFDVQRDYVRLVYDQPDQYRRFYLGDITSQFRDDQDQLEIGGFGVVRQRQIFDPSRIASLNSNQQFVLQGDSTVDILRNGQLLQQLHLPAGSYNLNNLPLVAGSNNVTIQIHGIAGESQTLNLTTYLDPIDLQPGDYEYAAYVGALSSTLFNQPHYQNDVAFTGYYRKAFKNANAFGVGLQADETTQMFDAEYRVVLPRGARLEVAGGVSNTKGFGDGFTASAEYDLSIDRGGLYDSLNARLRFDSPHFQTVGVNQPLNPEVWDLATTYTHSFSRNLQTSLNGFYAENRGSGKWSASINLDNAWRFNRHWTLHAGVGYQETETTTGGRKGVGALLSLIWRPTINYQVEADYDGVNKLETLTATKEHDNYVNDYGYSVAVQDDNGSPSISGEGDYIGNRFVLTVQGGTTGDTFSTLTSDPSASAIIGTSIGYVDGHFGIGRPITDSFMVAYANPNLGNRPVIIGDDLQQGHYDARSSGLGPALYANLPSYSDDTVHYDVENAPRGYDVGTGVVTARPLYRSGYSLKIGSDAFMSAAGTLKGRDGRPMSLVSGHVTPLDDPGGKSGLFFTNSVGRFAIDSLKPGHHYRVDLNTTESVSFTFETPKNGEALLDLKTISVDAAAD